jgi:hypothetical protein
MDAVIDIKKESDTPPIIIQVDHGIYCADIEERARPCFPILNTYYFPDANYTALYPEIFPVNSLRVVLNQYFNTNLPLLPDQHYFFDRIDGVDQFVDICEGYGYCP